MMKFTEGQLRADRILQNEMLRCGDDLRHARTWEEWSQAHLELEELGKAAKEVSGRADGVQQAEIAILAESSPIQAVSEPEIVCEPERL